jgi:hypothetical protein
MSLLKKAFTHAMDASRASEANPRNLWLFSGHSRMSALKKATNSTNFPLWSAGRLS